MADHRSITTINGPHRSGQTGRFIEARHQGENVAAAAVQAWWLCQVGAPKAARVELAIAENRVYTAKPSDAKTKAARWGFTNQTGSRA